MIRKFFAGILVLVFCSVLPPLIIAQSFSMSLLNEDALVHEFVPQSFDTASTLLAEQFSRKPEEITLFKERIHSAITPEIYSELMALPVHAFFQGVKEIQPKSPLTFNLQPLKDALLKRLPEIAKKFPACPANESTTGAMRFCKPKEFSDPKRFEQFLNTIVDKQMPARISLKNPDASSGILKTMLAVQKNLLIIIGVVSGVLLLLIALIIFSPAASVLKWVGSTIAEMGLLVALFVLSMIKLPEIATRVNILTSTQIDAISLLIKFIFEGIQLWSYFIIAGGIIIYIVGIFVKPKVHNSKQ